MANGSIMGPNPVTKVLLISAALTLADAAFPQGTVVFANRGGTTTALAPGQVLACNLTGAPALTVPCGFAASGLPVGLQIVGRPFEDATVLRVGHAYEQATEWHRRRPAI